MTRSVRLSATSLILLSATVFAVQICLASPGWASPGDTPRQLAGPEAANHSDLHHGGAPESAVTNQDSVHLIGPWGSGTPINGQFENAWGEPAWNGWTHKDMTQATEVHWKVSDFQAGNLNDHGNGNLAAWCGDDIYIACDPDDEQGGYGDNYEEYLVWTGTVADPSAPCVVTLDAWLNLDLEHGYDFLYLRYRKPDGLVHTVWQMDGRTSNFHLEETFVILPEDYVGDGGPHDQIQLEFVVMSDGAYSASDCLFANDGACQIDDISISLSNGGLYTFDDFQTGELGNWIPELVQGVGDFAQVWMYLEDIDPCRSNYTPQAAFIDDGVVVPGTGGQFCIDWCYGPGGYIVNTRGGLAGPDHYIHNRIMSPVVEWPANDAEGGLYSYGVYEHEDLSPDSPGIFHTWHVRSVNTGNPENIESAFWGDRNFVYYGPGQYRRTAWDVSDLLMPGATHVQVALSVQELGYVWGWVQDDGYPAPYFDNVSLVAFSMPGPAITARSIDLAQDAFPASGVIDQDNWANNAVRFDMAANISPAADMRNDPGDSIVVRVSPRRNGATLVGLPYLHYHLDPNPVFDPYRTSGLDNVGNVEGSLVQVGGNPLPDQYAFDLPDSGFFFPGDVLHYYIAATSNAGAEMRTATLPADTTGFSDFSGQLLYDDTFTVRALPTLRYNQYAGQLDQEPTMLLWMDGGDLDSWYDAMTGLDFDLGQEFDLYRTQGPSSGVGNGLGGRATAETMAGYRTLLYSCGNKFSATLSNGDYQHDAGDDIGLLDSWMNLGQKAMFLTGDDLVRDVMESGGSGMDFVGQWLRVSLESSNLRPLIDNQVTPRVLPMDGNQIFHTVDSWIAYGGCLGINTFDAVTAQYQVVRLAEFADPGGQPGNYIYSAATLYDLPEDKTVIPSHNSAVFTLPYAFQYIYTDPASSPPGPFPARQAVLQDVLTFLGEYFIWGDAEMTPELKFSAGNYPNPFNPVTNIKYTLPRADHLTIKVFDIKGRLIKTLVDEKREAGPGQASWSGKDNQGAEVSSGVYFYEVRSSEKVITNKMTLLK